MRARFPIGSGPVVFLGFSWFLRSSEGGVRMADKQADVSAVEQIKQASRGLRGSLAPELAADTSHFEDAAAQLLKFHGVYQQDDRDTRRQRSDAGLEPDYAFMVRCKIPGGVLTADQYLVLDELAGRYGNCTDVYSNDLGFVVIPDGDSLAGFNVLVGGGLGMTHGKKVTYPRLADPLGFATPEDVVQVAEAVITVQRDYGDRRDRRHARLKYLLDDRGLDWFRAQVEQRLGRPLRPPAPVRISDVHDHLGWHDQGGGRSFYGLFVENGRIQDAEDAQLRTAVRRIVEVFRAGVHFTPQQNLLLTGIAEERRAALDAMLADHGVRPTGVISTVR